MKRAGLLLGVVVAVAVGYTSASLAGELEDQGRAIVDKNQKAVVTVQMVIKQKFSMAGMGTQDNESKSETTGFIVDPSGLTVVSLTETDPSALMQDMMENMPNEDGFKVESQVSDIKLLLDDGTEMPARVVLRDKDLDLAFIRPEQAPAQPLTAIDLAQSADPVIMDPVLALNRLGKVAGRTLAVSLERISAVIRKPRTLFIPGNDPTHSGLGSPVFAMDGRIIGMLAMRRIKSEGGGGGMFGGMQDNMMGVVVPARDILDGAQQAPSVDKVPEQPEAPKEAPPEEKPADSAPAEGGATVTLPVQQ